MKTKNSSMLRYYILLTILISIVLGICVYSNLRYEQVDSFTPRTIYKHFPSIEEVCIEEGGRRLTSCELVESNQVVKYKKDGNEVSGKVKEFQIIETWNPISENEWRLVEVKSHHKCRDGITSLFWNTFSCK